MRIFISGEEESWGKKLNIVDENNVLVGFDYNHNCCENFGYGIVKKLDSAKENDLTNMPVEEQEKYIFDKSFFELNDLTDEYGEGGGEAIFKLVNKEDSNDFIYLILYNHHNGYYSHGFTMHVGGTTIQHGAL